MKLDALAVVHVRKDAGFALPAAHGSAGDVFHVETCLRRFWVDMEGGKQLAALLAGAGNDCLRGQDAYRLLLEIGCGLHSQIPGESEVLGQLRAAWKRFQEAAPQAAKCLEPLMQRLLEDIKDIRTRYLQGHGGATYGSLARLLLGNDLYQPTLLVGAGKMARAVAPYLSGRPLFLWNRTPQRLDELMEALACDPANLVDVHKLPGDFESELAAWGKAATIVLCVPADAEKDRKRLAAWGARAARWGRGRIIHLGLLSTEGTAWQSVQSLNTLQDLFNLRDARNELRSTPLARARAACAEKARLRSLGGSSTLPHGWEDLPFTLIA